LKQVLRDLANAYEKEEEGESSRALTERIDRLEAQLAGKNPTKTQVEDAAEELELDDDELAAVKEFLAERRKGSDAHGTPDGAAPDGSAGGDPPKPKTRPGRKSGQVYKWDVDDDGNVIALDIPKVFSGDDEPDRVELPAETEDEEDAA
jgi:hypothetical protein